uniref:tumor necrosis factor ligand superfamily member 15 n=1 Tax=Jaculus jaculus TaxID=51337 RepID=UPI001E1B3DF1|nr:tumor necrosis factor ligand superfamily member 15 [Jaculus jaculus]
MAEELELSFGEAANEEVLSEGGGCRPEARTRLAAGSKGRCARACCLLPFPMLAGLSIYLLLGQPCAQREDCAQLQTTKEQEFQSAPQLLYTPPRTDGDKPRAHLTIIKQSPTPHPQNHFPALHWEHELGLAFTKNQMNYTNKSLVVPKSGDYFIYSQITFRGTTSECAYITQGRRPNKPDSIIVVITKVTDSYREPSQLLTGVKSVCEISSNWFQPLYLGAMFSLKEGDKLMVNVSDVSLVDYTKEDKTFFGAFLL